MGERAVMGCSLGTGIKAYLALKSLRLSPVRPNFSPGLNCLDVVISLSVQEKNKIPIAKISTGVKKILKDFIIKGVRISDKCQTNSNPFNKSLLRCLVLINIILFKSERRLSWLVAFRASEIIKFQIIKKYIFCKKELKF